MPHNAKTVRLLVATANLKKLKELQELLEGLPVVLLGLKDFQKIRAIEETGSTFEENARLKALGYAGQTGCLTLGEDSGLCCDALNKAPGVLSARFSDQGTDKTNNKKLLEAMRDVPAKERTAYYESTVVLAEPGKVVGVAKGRVGGVITREPRGNGGFGYDPVFFYPPFKKTFGQVSAGKKHGVSHRGKALAKTRTLLLRYLRAQSR